MAQVIIFKGDKFLCKKDYKMNYTKEVIYTKGREYICEETDCITDNEGDKLHLMGRSANTLNEFSKYFIQIN